jgi:hypothetical protein
MRNWIFKNEVKPTQGNLVIAGFLSLILLWTPGANAASTTQEAARPGSPNIRCVHPAVTEAKIEIPDDLLVAIRFQKLASRWHAERSATSSIEEMCTTPAYLSIMAMGPSVIPIILRQIQSEGNNPDHWFVALHHLTQGVDPVPDEDKGDLVKMAAAWLKWADQGGDAR